MGTAATNAASHLTAEEAQTATLTTDKSTADGTLATDTAGRAAIVTLYDNAKTADDAAIAAAATAAGDFATATLWKAKYDL